MKVLTPRTQFDHPASSAAPATPSCCCCCCCCLATIITSSVAAGVTANTEATVNNQPTTLVTLLAILPQFLGMFVFYVGVSNDVPYGAALAFGVACAFGLHFFALVKAGLDNSAAIKKAAFFIFLYCVIFPIEFFGGAILVLFYVVPYLLVAFFVTFAAVNAQLEKRRKRLAAYGYTYSSMRGPENWQAGELEPLDEHGNDPYGNHYGSTSSGGASPPPPTFYTPGNPGAPAPPPPVPPTGPPTGPPSDGPMFDPRPDNSPYEPPSEPPYEPPTF